MELSPDRKLLDVEFSGYKLSLTPIPVHKKEIEGIYVLEPSDDQYSYLHQREFNLHNHLYGDIWNHSSVYFISKNKKVMRVSINDDSCRLENPQEVWEMSDMKPRLSGDYNPSLCFASLDIAVLSDGAGTLHVFRTSSRSHASEWKLLHSQFLFDEKRGFKVVDSRCINESPNRVVWCVLRNVVHCENKECSDKTSPRFEAVLQVVSLVEERGNWRLGEIKKLCHATNVEYSVLEPDCKAVYIAGDIPIQVKQKESELTGNGSPPEYFWQQNFEDIKIWFEVEEEVDKSEILVETKDLEIKVCHKENPLLEGKLFNRIDPSLTAWSLTNKKLEVVIEKREAGAMWEHLMEKKEGGKEVIDNAVVQEIHSKLSHLCSDKQEEGSTTMLNLSQLEECDAFDEESRTLTRLDLETLEPTLKIMLGGQQWMLNIEGEPERGGGFCLRYDNDGCVWVPSGQSRPLEHVGTFPLFGYIAASKDKKKFVIAPPDLSYVAIADVTNHIMIYRKGIAAKTEIRNRKTGQCIEKLAAQQLVHLQTQSQLLGAVARPSHIFIITTDHVYDLAITQNSN